MYVCKFSLCTLSYKRYKFMSIFRSHGYLMWMFFVVVVAGSICVPRLFYFILIFVFICRFVSVLSRASSFHFTCMSIPICFAKKCKSENKIENVLTPKWVRLIDEKEEQQKYQRHRRNAFFFYLKYWFIIYFCFFSIEEKWWNKIQIVCQIFLFSS